MSYNLNLLNYNKIKYLLLIFGIFIGLTSFISLKYSLMILAFPILILLFSFLVIKPWIGLLIYIFIIPLKRMVYFSASFFLAMPKIIGLIVFLTWLFNLIIYRKKKFLNVSHNYIILLFILMIFISGFSATYIPDFFIELIRYFMAFGLFFLICNTIKSKKQINTLIWILVMAVSISAFIGIIQHFTGTIFGNFSMISSYILNQNREFGGTLHPNELANYIVTIIPLFFISYHIKKIKNKKRIIFKRILFYTVLSIFIISLFLTKSRGGFIGFIFAIFLLFLISKNKKEIIFLSLLFIILILLFIPFNYFNRLTDFTKIFNPEDYPSMEIETRYNLQKFALYEFLKHPLLGVGSGNFKLLAYKNSIEIKRPLSPHNHYLKILAENGIFGILIFCSLFYMFVKKFKIINKIYLFNLLIISFILISFLLSFTVIDSFYHFFLFGSLIIVLCNLK